MTNTNLSDEFEIGPDGRIQPKAPAHDIKRCDVWKCEECAKVRTVTDAWMDGYLNAMKHVQSLSWIERLLLPFAKF